MLSLLDLRGEQGDLRRRLPRPLPSGPPPLEAVRGILAGVRQGGDAAVRAYTEQLDGVVVGDLRVPDAELKEALGAIPAPLREALEAAHDAIAAFHAGQLPAERRHERDGIVVHELTRPVERAGAYVPGGRARYPSTVLMTVVPAKVAGVQDVVLCVPPEPPAGVGGNGEVRRSPGKVATVTLAAAALAGADEVYGCGGAQAVAAMAYGTETIRPVDVIVGPGNVYVATAKREVAAEGVVGTPGAFAGPSEVVVVADDATPVEAAAIDLVVQAEHGPDGLAWLVTWSRPVAERVTAAVAHLVAASPRRAELESTLDGGGYAALVDGPEQAMAVVNAIAPEHLELMTADPSELLPLVRHAGAVFCGASSPAAVGDYLAGPSHVLPTSGSARFAGGLRVDDFLRRIHAISLDEEALARVAPYVSALAEAEGLPAHAQSVVARGESGAT